MKNKELTIKPRLGDTLTLGEYWRQREQDEAEGKEPVVFVGWDGGWGS